MKSVTRRRRADDQDMYMVLVQEFPLRPIRSDAELIRASDIADRLSIRDQLEPSEEDYLDVLDGLIEQYEKQQHPVQPLSDAELLRELMSAQACTQREVAEATGIVYSTISSVLAGRRRLTREQIGKLADYFHVSPGTFAFSA
jgi:HTH-type transcriptional regulator / antitoxin HigA